jgi:hypothetical protein
MDNWPPSAVGAVVTDRGCNVDAVGRRKSRGGEAGSRGGGTAPTGPGARRRGGTHGEASPQQRVQPPGAPMSVMKGQTAAWHSAKAVCHAR